MVPEPSRSKESKTSRALARRRSSGEAPRMRILACTVAALVRLVSWASSAFPAAVCERTRHFFLQGVCLWAAVVACVCFCYGRVWGGKPDILELQDISSTPFSQTASAERGEQLDCPWCMFGRPSSTNVLRGVARGASFGPLVAPLFPCPHPRLLVCPAL